MKWHIAHGIAPTNRALSWTHNFINQYDTSKLESIRISPGSNRYEGVYGHCHYPTKKRPTYRISCQVPGPLPCDISTRKRPLYADPNGLFPRAPRGCRRGALIFDPKSGKKWYRVRGKTRVETLDSGIAWILGHESFHFLRKTRQIPGRNTEIEADAFADQCLQNFLKGWPPPQQSFVKRLTRQLRLPWGGTLKGSQ